MVPLPRRPNADRAGGSLPSRPGQVSAISLANGADPSTEVGPRLDAFAYLGPDPHRFRDRFAEFGAVMRRWP